MENLITYSSIRARVSLRFGIYPERLYVSGAFGPTIASGYQLVGAADFNGDAKPDYLLYNPSTRKTALWYMNNNAYTGSAYGPTLPVGWSLVAP